MTTTTKLALPLSVDILDYARDYFYARIAAVGDPGDEPAPNRREEKEATIRRLEGALSEIAMARTHEVNIARKLAPLAPMRDSLLGALATLRTESLPAALARRDAVRNVHRAERDYRPEQLKLEEVQAAIASLESGEGWNREGLGLCVPPKLREVLPGLDWTKARSLAEIERRIAELEKRRHDAHFRALPYVEQAMTD